MSPFWVLVNELVPEYRFDRTLNSNETEVVTERTLAVNLVRQKRSDV